MNYRHADTYDRSPDGFRPCPSDDCDATNPYYDHERRPTHCGACGQRLTCAGCGETCATNERGDCAECVAAEPVVLDTVWDGEFGVTLVAREVGR